MVENKIELIVIYYKNPKKKKVLKLILIKIINQLNMLYKI